MGSKKDNSIKTYLRSVEEDLAATGYLESRAETGLAIMLGGDLSLPDIFLGKNEE